MPNLHRALLALVGTARACSNVLVTGGASADGNSMVGYNADSAALLGAVSHWPHGRHAAGAVREVYSWDLGIKLGEIPEAPTTYNVIGNANCQGLVIGETTLGGLALAMQKAAKPAKALTREGFKSSLGSASSRKCPGPT